jgi:hypothetical protein
VAVVALDAGIGVLLGLVDLPAVPDAMPTGSGGLGQQRREPLGPAVDGDVIDLDAAFGEQLLDVAVRQREAQGPADRQHDHVGREAEAGQGRSADASGAGDRLVRSVKSVRVIALVDAAGQPHSDGQVGQ